MNISIQSADAAVRSVDTAAAGSGKGAAHRAAAGEAGSQAGRATAGSLNRFRNSSVHGSADTPANGAGNGTANAADDGSRPAAKRVTSVLRLPQRRWLRVEEVMKMARARGRKDDALSPLLAWDGDHPRGLPVLACVKPGCVRLLNPLYAGDHPLAALEPGRTHLQWLERDLDPGRDGGTPTSASSAPEKAASTPETDVPGIVSASESASGPASGSASGRASSRAFGQGVDKGSEKEAGSGTGRVGEVVLVISLPPGITCAGLEFLLGSGPGRVVLNTVMDTMLCFGKSPNRTVAAGPGLFPAGLSLPAFAAGSFAHRTTGFSSPASGQDRSGSEQTGPGRPDPEWIGPERIGSGQTASIPSRPGPGLVGLRLLAEVRRHLAGFEPFLADLREGLPWCLDVCDPGELLDEARAALRFRRSVGLGPRGAATDAVTFVHAFLRRVEESGGVFPLSRTEAVRQVRLVFQGASTAVDTAAGTAADTTADTTAADIAAGTAADIAPDTTADTAAVGTATDDIAADNAADAGRESDADCATEENDGTGAGREINATGETDAVGKACAGGTAGESGALNVSRAINASNASGESGAGRDACPDCPGLSGGADGAFEAPDAVATFRVFPSTGTGREFPAFGPGTTGPSGSSDRHRHRRRRPGRTWHDRGT